jgi:ABC-type glycerol-3-phosphate transport system substrate-binding protein
MVRYLKDWTAVDKAGNKILEGKMRAIPLPIFEPGDARTGTWGGTMMAITRASPRPDDAWKLIEHIYLSDEGFETRIRETNILPPVISQWDDPRYGQPDPFFGGQKVNEIYIELARELPERYVSPATRAASGVLTDVLLRAINHVEERGSVGLEEACAKWLKDAAAELEKRIEWGKFD